MSYIHPMMVIMTQLYCVCCANCLLPVRAGAPQGDPGDCQRRSLRAPSSGVRQEEADSPQAAHAQDGGGVSTGSRGNLSDGRGERVPLIQAFDSCRLDYGKKRGNTRQEKERERLKHKFKREHKGALREIRKDSRFLASEKLKEVMGRLACGDWRRADVYSSADFAVVQDSQDFFVFFLFVRDAERKRKVKELMGSLASQEGEWKALKKRKRK